MARVLIIGYGNPLRGDDALGAVAVEQLRPLLPEAKFVSCHQLAPELAEAISASDLAVFIDAAADGRPGEIVLQELFPEQEPASMTHHLRPDTLLQLACTLYGRSPRALLVTGVGADFALAEGLSEQARHALDEICRALPLLVRSFPAMW